jgi:hypothetical protein
MASPYHTWSDFIGFWIFVCFVGTILMVNVTPCAMERSQSSMLIEEIFLLFLEDCSAGIPGQ